MYNPFFNNQMPVMNFQQPRLYQPQFITKQVTSVDEAKASMIDPLSTYLFIDTSTGKIYLKRLNNNGLADFFTYSPENITPQKEINPIEEINNRLTNIEKILGENNVKSISDDAKSTAVNDGTNEKSKSTTFPKSSGNDEW